MVESVFLRTGVALCLAGVFASLGLGVKRHKSRPGKLCEIPAHDYRPTKSVGNATVLSRTAILVEAPLSLDQREMKAAGQPTVKLKYFHLEQPSLAIDHCSISRVVATVDDNNQWSLSLRADQNAQGAGAVGNPNEPTQLKQTGHLKRNQFTITVRFLGAYQGVAENAKESLGRPVIFRPEPITFWVQRGEPLDVYRTGTVQGGAGANPITQVDRVEIDFAYR